MSQKTEAGREEGAVPRIFCWVNSGSGTDWQVVLALAEDGHCLAEHVSSSESWAMHDIGLTSDWKHDLYRAHYPAGYELEWVQDPRKHAGLDAAYAKNQARATTPDSAPSLSESRAAGNEKL